jgi:hypothetical protein
LFEYHYDRNALVASEPSGDSIVALTKAGHLLRFSQRTLELTGEQMEERRALALGPASDGGILVGFASGYIGRLDVHSLETTTVGSVPGHPYWIGRCAGVEGPVVAYGSWGAHPFLKRYPAPYFLKVRLLATGQEVRAHGGALHCDGKGHLWAGLDQGEWGGGVEVIDLHASKLAAKRIAPADEEHAYWHGVYGFTDADDGSTLVFGGTSHMGLLVAFIARVSESAPTKMLYAGEPPERGPEPNAAFGPISHVVRRGDGYTVFALGRIYECDSAFAHWKKVALQGLHSTRGRPDAVGSYPGLVGVREMADGRFLLTSRLDGLLELDGVKKNSHALVNQPAYRVDSITTWRSGLAAFGDESEPVGLLMGGRWRSPFAGLPAVEEPNEYVSAAVLPLKDGRALLVAATTDPNLSPSPLSLVTAKLEGERIQVLEPQSAGDKAGFRASSKAFSLPDGTPAVQSLDDRVWSFDGERWAPVKGADSRLHIVKAIAPDLLIVSESWDKPWLARVELPFKTTRVTVRVEGREASVEDAIVLDEDHLLVATNPVLCMLDLRSGECEILRTGADDEARRVARDARGRIWIAGRGLWRLDGQGRAIPYPLHLPFLRDAEIGDLEMVGDRLALAMGEQGVALLDPDAKPDLRPAPREEPLQDFEPRYDDGAVIVSCTPPESEKEYSREPTEFQKQYDQLDEQVSSGKVLGGPRDSQGQQEKYRTPRYELVFHSADPDGLALRVVAVVKASPLASRLRVMKRSGPRGYTPLVDVYAGSLAAQYEP